MGKQRKAPNKEDTYTPELWKMLEWVGKKFGVVGIVVLVVILGWWNLDTIRSMPGVEKAYSYLFRSSLPKPENGKFNIAVTHLVGDTQGVAENSIITSIQDIFPFAHTKIFDRRIVEGDEPLLGVEQAQRILKESGFDVIIWGETIPGAQSLLRLHLTAPININSTYSKRYQKTEDQNLPNLFWQDLTNILSLLAVTHQLKTFDSSDVRDTKEMEVFIFQLEELLKKSKIEQWESNTRSLVQLLLANELAALGQTKHDKNLIERAIPIYEEALLSLEGAEYKAIRLNGKMNIGAAKFILGSLISDEHLLLESKKILSDLLAGSVELDREERASINNNLGSIFNSLGQIRSDASLMYKAIDFYREALSDRNKDEAPLTWIETKRNLGNVFFNVGELLSDPNLLNESLSEYRDIYDLRYSSQLPLKSSIALVDIGRSLNLLASLQNDKKINDEAITVERQAISEIIFEISPYDWARAYLFLGNALYFRWSLSHDKAALEESIASLEEARKGFAMVGSDDVKIAEKNISLLKSLAK